MRINKLKKIAQLFFFLSAVLLFTNFSFCQEWKQLSSEHFMVFFTSDENFAEDMLDKAEVYYKRIASDLGYPRYSDFWLWDDRVKIYIYPDHASFLKATGQPDWSQGMADYKNKEIISYAWSKGFVEALLPHEMGHLIFRDFVGFKGEIPLWLDEGVAQWSEEARRGHSKAVARKLYDEDALLSIDDMMKLDIRRMRDKDKIYVRPTRTKDGGEGVLLISVTQLIDTYYAQSVSLVGFLIEKYGSLKFAEFCRELRDGKSLESALKSAYPNRMQSLQDLEERWREYLEEN